MEFRSNYIDRNIFNHKVSSYRMVDISLKNLSYRRACVVGSIYVGKSVLSLIENKKIQKGDPLLLAEIAGINAAKKTSSLILLCHQINIDNVFISIKLNKVTCELLLYCVVCAFSKTGVEMEAMMGVSVGLLTIYDLTKKLNPFIYIKNIKLLFKDGGENGLILGSCDNIPKHLKMYFSRKNILLKDISVILITVSDRANSGIYADHSGKIMREFFLLNESVILDMNIIADNEILLTRKLIYYINKYSPNLIVTSGGTGLSKRDITVNVILKLCNKIIPGIGELLRYSGAKYTNTSWLSCTVAGIYKKTLIISLPGKPSAVIEGLSVIGNLLFHSIKIINK